MGAFSTFSTYTVPDLLDQLRDIQRQLNDGARIESGSAVGNQATKNLASWEHLQQTHDSLIMELKTRAAQKAENWELIPASVIEQTAEQTSVRQGFSKRPADN